MASYGVGVDVGGTKLAAGLVDLLRGQVMMRRTQPTLAERGGLAVLSDTLAMVHSLQQERPAAHTAPLSIGVAVCELVDPTGAITSGQAVAWQGLPVGEHFARLGPTRIEADVRAHALAEARYGAGQAYDWFVFVSVGTGISSCIVQGGRPLPGAHGNALIFSSGPISIPCSHCGRQTRFVLEEYASGPALVARYNQQRGAQFQKAEELFVAAAQGDQQAKEVLVSGGYALGSAIGWLINLLDPQAVIIGGGLGTSVGLYWDAVVSAAREHIWAETSRAIPIERAALGADAGLIGAALVGALL
jgi:glucokinase